MACGSESPGEPGGGLWGRGRLEHWWAGGVCSQGWGPAGGRAHSLSVCVAAGSLHSGKWPVTPSALTWGPAVSLALGLPPPSAAKVACACPAPHEAWTRCIPGPGTGCITLGQAKCMSVYLCRFAHSSLKEEQIWPLLSLCPQTSPFCAPALICSRVHGSSGGACPPRLSHRREKARSVHTCAGHILGGLS